LICGFGHFLAIVFVLLKANLELSSLQAMCSIVDLAVDSLFLALTNQFDVIQQNLVYGFLGVYCKGKLVWFLGALFSAHLQ
jgi:hypothetical protein